MLTDEIHELRDEEMKAVKDADEDRKEMKKLKGENEKLKEDKNTFQNLWIQRETQITYFTEQLKKREKKD